MTEEKLLQKLNLLGINDPHQLEAEELNFWWQKKYKEIKDSLLRKETINDKLNEINQILLELSKRKKWKLIEILSKSINEKDENKVYSNIDLHNLGVQLFNEKEYEKSIKKFSEAIDLKSEESLHFNLRGWAYYYLQQYDKALEDAHKPIRVN